MSSNIFALTTSRVVSEFVQITPNDVAGPAESNQLNLPQFGGAADFEPANHLVITVQHASVRMHLAQRRNFSAKHRGNHMSQFARSPRRTGQRVIHRRLRRRTVLPNDPHFKVRRARPRGFQIIGG